MRFVTALYATNQARSDAILERARVLAQHVPLHVVCDHDYFDQLSAIPGVVPVFHAYATLDTYQVMRDTTSLPRVRDSAKDTRDYMIVVNAKTECIRIVRNAGYVASMYAWIDAGIAKVLTDPAAVLSQMRERCAHLEDDVIRIPGCWATPAERLELDAICWRFCGGFFVVPDRWVDALADAVLGVCRDLAQHSHAVWEVNVWAWLEATRELPIVWSPSDHNDTIFNLKNE